MKIVLVPTLFSLLSAIFCTPLVIKFFRRRGFGQEIRDDGPLTHMVKRGTPTMGGVAIIGSTVAGYVAAHVVLEIRDHEGFTASGLLLMLVMVGLGAVGFLDDFIKIRHQRSLGGIAEIGHLDGCRRHSTARPQLWIERHSPVRDIERRELVRERVAERLRERPAGRRRVCHHRAARR